MVEKSQDKEMDKSVAVGNVENNSENTALRNFDMLKIYLHIKANFKSTNLLMYVVQFFFNWNM